MQPFWVLHESDVECLVTEKISSLPAQLLSGANYLCSNQYLNKCVESLKNMVSDEV